MGKGGFRRDASSKMLNHNRPRPVQESQENGKAPPAFRSLEGSCGEMDRARPPRRNRNRESVHAGPDSEAGGSWDQHWYSSESSAGGTALASMVTSSFPQLLQNSSCSEGKTVVPQRSDNTAREKVRPKGESSPCLDCTMANRERAVIG